MLLVLTGASCSGKTTLLQHVLNRKGVQEIRLLSTAFCKDTIHVSEDQFNAVEDMVLLSDGEYKTGISLSTLSSLSNDIHILQCSYEEAMALSTVASKLNTSSVCVFLHCCVSELLCRLHDKLKAGTASSECCDMINEIYADHNMAFVRLENQTIEESGFTAVLPINTGSTMETYVSKIVKPLFSLFDAMSVYKNMKALRYSPERLMKYANQ